MTSGRRERAAPAPRACSVRAVALLTVLLLAACTKGEPLTATSIESAQARWRAANLSSYRLQLTISGDRVESGDVAVHVKDGEPAKIERNGQPVSTRDDFYTVEGMFTFLRDELHMAREPAHYWGVAEGSRVHQRAQFDEDLGHLKRYVRGIAGTKHNISILVDELQPVK